MNRRNFLRCTGTSLLLGTGVLGVNDPVLGAEFRINSVKNVNGANVNSILIDFEKFSLNPQYIRDSSDLKISIGVTADGVSNTVSQSIPVSNTNSVRRKDLNVLPIVIDGIETTSELIDGEVLITLDHPDIGSKSYRQDFIVSPGSAVTDDLVSRYKLDSGSGSTAVDSVGSNDGSISGASWTDDAKVGSYALSFDGSGDNIDISSFKGFQTTGFSLSLWQKSLGQSGSTLIQLRSNNETYIRRRSNSITWNIIASGGNNISVGGPNSIDYTVYRHIGATWDGSNMRFYVDGDRKDSASQNDMDSQGGDDSIGGNIAANGRYFEGEIDDVRIYDRPLSDSEMFQIYQNTS